MKVGEAFTQRVHLAHSSGWNNKPQQAQYSLTMLTRLSWTQVACNMHVPQSPKDQRDRSGSRQQAGTQHDRGAAPMAHTY